MNETTLIALENLKRRGFVIHTFETAEAMADFLVSAVGEEQSVGFGGSMTLCRDLQIYQRLREKNPNVWYHGVPGDLPREEIFRRAHSADVYMLSANAISADGAILNIDGSGNRLAALMFGPKTVYMAVSESKFCPDRESAMTRVKTVACPQNTRRLGKKTPCAMTDKCADCMSPDRICSYTLWMDWAPKGREFHICVCPGELGF